MKFSLEISNNGSIITITVMITITKGDNYYIQPGTGLPELDRIRKALNEKVYSSFVLGVNKAAILCSDARYMDLGISQEFNYGISGAEGFKLQLSCYGEPVAPDKA